MEIRYAHLDLSVTERRAVLANDVFVSQMALAHAGDSARDFWLVLWTRRPNRGGVSIVDIDANPQALSFLECHEQRKSRFSWALGCHHDADSWSVSHSSVPGPELEWDSSPFVQVMSRGGLPGLLPTPTESSTEGYFFGALAYPVTVPPGEKVKLNLFAALAEDVEAARASLDDCVGMIDPIHTSEEDWITWFEDVPSLECSDRRLQRAYWHGWAERKVWHRAVRPGRADEFVTAAGRMIESVWRVGDQDFLDDLDALLRNSRASELPMGLILRRAQGVLGSEDFREELMARGPMLRSLVDRGSAGGSTNHADALGRRSLSVDLARTLSLLTEEEGSVGMSERADALMRSLREEHALPDGSWFVESPSSSDTRGRRRSLAGVLPMLSGLTTPAEDETVWASIFDPEHFWTSPPVPTLSRSDPDFRPRLEGDATFDGRVLPGWSSLVLECLGRSAESRTPQDRLLLVQFVRSMVEMVYLGGDVDRPQSHDSYHPVGGYPSTMLGPSPPGGWLVDHLLRFVAGLRPAEDGVVVIDPLPFGVEWFRLERAIVRDHEIDIDWDQRSGLSIRVDGQPAGHAPVGRSLSMEIPDDWDRPRATLRRALLG
jgi:hypothetical protein